MKLELSRYRNGYDSLKRHLASKLEANIDRAISEWSVGNHTPILVCYCYANEILGTKEYEDVIKRLMLFYNIKEIIE